MVKWATALSLPIQFQPCYSEREIPFEVEALTGMEALAGRR